jgi:hypothetical protein
VWQVIEPGRHSDTCPRGLLIFFFFSLLGSKLSHRPYFMLFEYLHLHRPDGWEGGVRSCRIAHRTKVVVGNIEDGRKEVVDSRCSHVRISSWATLVSIVNGGESAKNISSWPPFIMLNDHDPAFTPERVLALLRNESVPTPPISVARHG